MKIGLLLPRSVLYPAIAFDILDGVKTGLKAKGVSDFEIVTANIGLAAKDDEIYKSCEQLLMNGVQVVVAYINPVSAEFIHPLFENSGSLLLVLDSGYHFPTSLNKLSHAFYLSLQGTLCCRIAGRMAMGEGYKDFAYVTSFYDAGYRSGYTFSTSVTERGGSIRFNHITALKRSDFTLEPLNNFLHDNAETGVLASFCGDMAEDFLREATHILGSRKVFGSPFMAEEIWLGKIAYPGHDWQCAAPWATTLDNAENKTFVADMENVRAGKANIFSLLGWEAAVFVSEILKTGLSVEKSIAAMEGKTLETPRGTLHISADKHLAEAPVYRVSVTKDEATGNCRVGEITPVEYTEQERESFYNDIQSLTTNANTWQNAYACLDS